MPYAPVGRCIYCGKRVPEVPRLTDEHIIPLSLNGTLILPASSCDACASETGKVEQVITRNALAGVRAHLEMRTRRPKQRPTRLPVREAGTNARLEIPIAEHPFWLVLQEFERPQFLGLPRHWPHDPKLKPDQIMTHIKMHTSPDTESRNKALGGVGVEFTLSPDNMLRMVAKIAHAYATAELDGTFEPYLTDYIRGKISIVSERNWLVGSLPGQVSRATIDNNAEELPSLSHQIELRRVQKGSARFLTAQITLFQEMEMPVYEAIVGRLTIEPSSSDPIRSFTQAL